LRMFGSSGRYIIVAKVIYQRSIFKISLCTSQHLVMSKRIRIDCLFGNVAQLIRAR
jgi:hypothetical protein